MTKPMEPMTIPPQLSHTLEHIVGQLDILTQVRNHSHKLCYMYVCLDCIYTRGEAHNNGEQIKGMS